METDCSWGEISITYHLWECKSSLLCTGHCPQIWQWTAWSSYVSQSDLGSFWTGSSHLHQPDLQFKQIKPAAGLIDFIQIQNRFCVQHFKFVEMFLCDVLQPIANDFAKYFGCNRVFFTRNNIERRVQVEDLIITPLMNAHCVTLVPPEMVWVIVGLKPVKY